MRGDFHIGEWLVQPQLNQICSPQTTVRIEPKAMAVLLCLAKHRDEVLSKSTLKKAVWPNTYVTDHVLVRCVSDLRKVFQDDARDPKIIQTISRRGYRLIPPTVHVPVSAVAHGPQSPGASTAVQDYLKGRCCYEQGSHASLIRAIAHLEKAVGADPRFARAYAALADCYSFMAQSGFENPDDCYHRSKAAAETALELDALAPEPHAAFALARMCHDLKWDAAEEGFRRSIELKPDYSCAHHWLALCLLARRRLDEAVEEAEIARSIDPISLPFAEMRVRTYFAIGAFQEAANLCLEMLDLRPGNPLLQWLQCEAYWHQGKLDLAREHLELFRGRANLDEVRLVIYDAIFSGEREKAAGMLHGLGQAGVPGNPVASAKVCAWLGKTRQAFAWLDQAFERKDTGVLLLDVEPSFVPLRSYRQFEILARKLRLR